MKALKTFESRLEKAIEIAKAETDFRLKTAWQQFLKAEAEIVQISLENIMAEIVNLLTDHEILCEELPDTGISDTHYEYFVNKVGICFPLVDAEGCKREIVIAVTDYNIKEETFTLTAGWVYAGDIENIKLAPIAIRLPQEEWTGLPREEDLDEMFVLKDVDIKTRELVFADGIKKAINLEEALDYIDTELLVYEDLVTKKGYKVATPPSPVSKEKQLGI